MFRKQLFWPLVGLLLVTLVACGGNVATVSPTTTVVAPGQPPTATLPPAAPTQATEPALPTATTEPTVSPADTAAPASTATSTPQPRTRVATRQPRATIAPLSVAYEVVAIKRVAGEQATLTLKVIATGGGGGYRYYHDDLAQSGAIFTVAGTCSKPFVHTLKVTTASGQMVVLPYHVNGRCPTPTP